jgi:hypothetical protein
MMHIGCQHHTHGAWFDFSDDEIEQISEGALDFWNKNRELLIFICKRESSN